jgi:hypothetical protein
MIRATLLESRFYAPRILEGGSGECCVSFQAPADERQSSAYQLDQAEALKKSVENMHNIQIPISSEPAARPMQAYLRAPAQSGKTPAIIVAHELFGVNADIHGIVDQLAAQGYVALAPEFYHRSAPAGEVLERNDEGRKRGFEYLNQITRNTIASPNFLLSRL